jgi:type I restriction enzyme S subunit
VANPDFIYYVLSQNEITEHLQAIGEQSVSAYPSIKSSDIEELEISLPSITEQERIVTVLSAIDEKIKNNNQINNNLEAQAIALYKAWFVDFQPYDGQKPASWVELPLEKVTALVSRGITPKYSDDSDQIILNQKCIRNHAIDLASSRFHTPKAITEKWLQFGDLLINSTGTGTLGRAAQVLFEPNNLTVDSHVTIVRPTDPLYVYFIGLWGITHETEIEALHTGSTGQTELPRDRIKSMKILLPDAESLIKFNGLIEPLSKLMVNNQDENIRLAEVRDALLPRLLSGELDVAKLDL